MGTQATCFTSWSLTFSSVKQEQTRENRAKEGVWTSFKNEKYCVNIMEEEFWGFINYISTDFSLGLEVLL